jgi:hypothetical protein
MFVEEVRESGSKGNFMTAWSRRNIDQDLYFFLEKNWKNSKFPLRLLDPPLPTWSHEVAKNWTRYSKYGTFARSDHASFWYPIDRDKSFNAILLSDLGLCSFLTNSFINTIAQKSLMIYKNIAN